MKKYLTLNNFLVLFGIVNILLYLAPAILLKNSIIDEGATMNLFAATFGGSFTLPGGPTNPLSLVASPGLVVAFVFAIIAIILNVLKNKTKLAGLIACPLYLTSGILVICTGTLVANANTGILPPMTVSEYYVQGGAIAVGTIFCVIATFVLIDFIASIAKPRQQQVAY